MTIGTSDSSVRYDTDESLRTSPHDICNNGFINFGHASSIKLRSSFHVARLQTVLP